MQPFDALTMKAVLQEAKPILLNRRVESIEQLGRDKLVLSLRNRFDVQRLLICAHAVYGHLCLLKEDTKSAILPADLKTRSSFLILLRKVLSAATLIAIEQLPGERVCDFIFSCIDAVGCTSIKTLTAEIMGRYSNIILWQRNDQTILSASHAVTKDMSRRREILPGLKYTRPPVQQKANILQVAKEEFLPLAQSLKSKISRQESAAEGSRSPDFLIDWLMSNFCGLGKHLAGELAVNALAGSDKESDEPIDLRLWQGVERMQEWQSFQPCYKLDLSCYSLFAMELEQRMEKHWKALPTVNDLIAEYYRLSETEEQFQQMQKSLRRKFKQELAKLEAKLEDIDNADEHETISRYKSFGDLILVNLAHIQTGQTELTCDDCFSSNQRLVTIPLDPNCTASQNAQRYYRQFTKSKNRQNSTEAARQATEEKRKSVNKMLLLIDQSATLEELGSIERLSDPQASLSNHQHSKSDNCLKVTSSDGWTIYVGRNRQENHWLLSRLAQPKDIWMHILGRSGPHVLIKVSSTKEEPPLRTLMEGANLAARLGKVANGAKVRIVYTECRYLKKIGNKQLGVVRYQREKTLEIGI